MASHRKHAADVQEGPDAARRFDGMMDHLLRIPKEELAKREAEYQEARRKKTKTPHGGK